MASLSGTIRIHARPEARPPPASAVVSHAHRPRLESRPLFGSEDRQDLLVHSPMLEHQVELGGGGLVMQGLECLGIGGRVPHGLAQGLVCSMVSVRLGLDGSRMTVVDGLDFGLLGLR